MTAHVQTAWLLLLSFFNQQKKKTQIERAKHTFTFNGQPLMYSAKQALFYEQDIIESCINMDKESDFVAGEYTVELYTEGYMLGSSKVILK